MHYSGYIDLHNQGGNGGDSRAKSVEEIHKITEFHGKHGTAKIVLTTHAEPLEDLKRHIKLMVHAIKEGTPGAQIIGINLEGPYVNPLQHGGMRAECLREPNLDEIKELVDISQGNIKMLTISPELPGAIEVIKYLSQNKIVASIGHSRASFEQVQEAVAAGVTHVTHIFNAMPALHHRSPGIVTACLLDERLTLEVIADGYHLHPEVIKLILKTVGKDRIVLVTDAVSMAGLPDGNYEEEGRKVIVKNGLPLLEDGTIWGSTLTLDRAVENMAKFTGISREDAVQMATLNPARVIADRPPAIDYELFQTEA